MDKDTLLAIALAKKGGGGGGSAPYTKTVLAGNDTSYLVVATLSESYKNFDALLLEIQAGMNPETGDDIHGYSPYIPTDSDIGVHYKIPLVFDGYNTGYCDFTILSDTSIQWLDENCKLIKVIGVKFGDFSSAGGASSLSELSDVSISSPYYGQQLMWDGTKWVNVKLSTEETGVLIAGQTSVTISNAAIDAKSTIDIYTNVYGVSPTNVTVSDGSVTLTFEARQTNLDVKVRIS